MCRQTLKIPSLVNHSPKNKKKVYDNYISTLFLPIISFRYVSSLQEESTPAPTYQKLLLIFFGLVFITFSFTKDTEYKMKSLTILNLSSPNLKVLLASPTPPTHREGMVVGGISLVVRGQVMLVRFSNFSLFRVFVIRYLGYTQCKFR